MAPDRIPPSQSYFLGTVDLENGRMNQDQAPVHRAEADAPSNVEQQANAVPDTNQPHNPQQMWNPEHISAIEDGVVELFVHQAGYAKYVGARYHDALGNVLREDRFIKRLDDFAIPPMGTASRFAAGNGFMGANLHRV